MDSFLLLAWFGEPMISLASALSIGFAVNFPEKAGNRYGGPEGNRPAYHLSPPRSGRASAAVQVKIMDTTPFKRLMYRPLCRWGKDRRNALAGKPVQSLCSRSYGVAHVFLSGRCGTGSAGLSRVSSALTGGSAIGPDVLTFFHALGVNLEASLRPDGTFGVSCIHRRRRYSGNTVGLPLPGTEMSISAETARSCLKSDGRLQRILTRIRRNRGSIEKTAGFIRETRDASNLMAIWCWSLMVAGCHHAAGRFAFRTPAGRKRSRSFPPYIKEAVVIGKDRPYLTALVCIDGRMVGKWAGDNKISYTTYSDLPQNPRSPISFRKSSPD